MTNTEPQAITSERLAEIRMMVIEAGFTAANTPDPEWAYNLHSLGTELLAEVERLRAQVESDKETTWKLVHAYNERGEQLKAALAVVRAVANGKAISVDEDMWGLLFPDLRHSYVQSIHEQARALLASAEAEAGNADEQAAQSEE